MSDIVWKSYGIAGYMAWYLEYSSHDLIAYLALVTMMLCVMAAVAWKVGKE